MFSEAFAPWLPTLQEIEVKKDPHTELGRYYLKFGFEQLVVPADCPHVAARKDELKILFDQRYAFRMINQETLER